MLAKIREARGSLEGLTPEVLFAHDQDHYGGLAANDALAEAAGIDAGQLVLDVACGLGGPARYQAWKHGCRVIGIDASPARVQGARELTELVHLDRRVAFLYGDAQDLPFTDGSFDVVLSQEAFLHLKDKAKGVAEAFRVLRAVGRFVFTDWVAGPAFGPEDRGAMWSGIAARGVPSVWDYMTVLEAAGFTGIAATDLSAAWVPILRDRLGMYETLRADAIRRTGEDPHRDYCRFYARFVELAETGAIGGARFIAVK